MTEPQPIALHRAQTVHRTHFPQGDVELATLLSIKTGGCEEDCSYCPQAARHDTGIQARNPEADDDRALLAKLGLPTRAALPEQAPRSTCGA